MFVDSAFGWRIPIWMLFLLSCKVLLQRLIYIEIEKDTFIFMFSLCGIENVIRRLNSLAEKKVFNFIHENETQFFNKA
jgi:hypothetical protein